MTGMLTLWGLIWVAVFVVWRGNNWYAKRSPAHADTLEGEQYNYYVEFTNYGSLMKLLLTFDVPRERFFRLRREGWFDTFGKRTHLAIEPAVDEHFFDKMFFIDSDDEAVVALFREQRKLRSQLIVFMARLRRQGAEFISMGAENGKLSLYMQVSKVPEPVRLRAECVDGLIPLLQAVRNLPIHHDHTPRESESAKENVRRIGAALFALGSLSVTWIFFMSPDRLLNPEALARVSAILGVLAFLALTFWAQRHLGRASNRHRALALWIVLSSIGTLGCSFTALRAANIHLDFAKHESFPIGNAKLSSYYRRRIGTTYRISYRLDGWSEYRTDTATISWLEYRRMRKMWNDTDSGSAILRNHPGLLGFKWKEIDPQWTVAEP